MAVVYKTQSVEETEALAERLASLFRKGDVLAFRGGMGVGKTAFVRGLARGLDLVGEVASPTFSLVNEYHGVNFVLYHFDMYRITGMEDLYSTGFFDYLDTLPETGMLAIEWSEEIDGCLPDNTTYISIVATGEECRQIQIDGDERFDHTGD
ncbi:MAG TPA: tRNA (adenosine(37)-N6)-threonylcarbamoyltransferase complex ATPase subunit type 1 TsaE [Firmicutes bacterium]|nr:tRNA (adenosine(37)-N6)-threonylcarbamoyltransferase complex ATPase subunit type 1 TsaE [Bacillota bacterium]